MGQVIELPRPGSQEIANPALAHQVLLNLIEGSMDDVPDEFMDQARRQAAALEAYDAHWSPVARMAEIILGDRLLAEGHIHRGKPTEFGKLSPNLRSGSRRMAQAREALIPELRQAAEGFEAVEDPHDRERLRIPRDRMVKLAQRWLRENSPASKPGDIIVHPDADDVTIGDATLLPGDFRDRLADAPDRSIDLILTDPPYPAESLPLWSDLAKLAAVKLADRGRLVAWTGQMFLPEVFDRLRNGGLQYGWTFCLGLPGSNSRIMGRHIIQHWKPVVAFSVGSWPSGEWIGDVLTSPAADKTDYRWQQTIQPAVELIEGMCPPDGLVVDPFLGVGTFAVAALSCGRRFIGCEPDGERFKTAVKRIQAEKAAA